MKESSHRIFNQFKIHTQYSICEGAVKIDQLKDFCKKNKIRSLGLSDTFNLSGALEFSENLSSVGTQPIIGTQILFKYKSFYGLIPLIAKNNNGYTNKEMLALVLERMSLLEEKLDEMIESKVSRYEMYSVLSALVAVGALVGYLTM